MFLRRMCSVVTTAVPTKVCIVGAGPAGFYVAQHLSKKINSVQVDIIEKLPVPFGLIRYGVAPDHPDVKNVINTFTKTAQQANVRFLGNITLGQDVTLAQLRQNYHVVILTYGAEEDKFLGIENEDSKNVIAARRFVGWYNGLPDDKDLKVDLSGRTAAVLGQGNVGIDVARMLLTSIDTLSKTDITQHALQALAESKIREVFLIGRRGPLQAAFTIKELREMLKLPNVSTQWRPTDFTGIEELIPDIQRPKKRLTELMIKSVKEMPENPPPDAKLFRPIFCRSPSRFLTDGTSKLEKLELVCNRLVGEDFMKKSCEGTDEREILDCDVAFRSIGYRSVQADKDINYDSKKGLVSNTTGRVIKHNSSSDIDRGLYVAGWLGTGPVGVILNTMSNSFQVAGNVVEDVSKAGEELKINEQRGGFDEISKILAKNNVQVVDWSGWQKIDKHETEAGKKLGKPREKICDVKKMLEIAL